MSSREAQIARHLACLSFGKISSEVRDEIRQSIVDYFVSDDIDDESVAAMSDACMESPEQEAVADVVVPVASTSQARIINMVSADDVVERAVFDVGTHKFPGDEGF